ncbi:MAG: HRDC domain-containing protein, partial [Candidatus Omnitrophica bacterium]|nr:HRDC domain-containing protein [Candidatus Omnitrophota bacterium]
FSEQSANREVMLDKLRTMYNFCTQPQCRHKVFVNYFGQEYGQSSCQACDYCLGEVDMVDDPLGVGQKILQCIDNVKYGDDLGFGAGYIANVLKGNLTEQITRWAHQNNSNFGVMSSETLIFIRYLIEQLIGQSFLERRGEYDTLSLTDLGRQLLSGEITPILAKPLVAAKKKEISKRQKAKKAKDWAGVDEELFELLRGKRAELAQKQGVPAYIIFGDKSLKDMASGKPTTCEDFSGVFGVGEHKLKIYAEPFLSVIKKYLEK